MASKLLRTSIHTKTIFNNVVHLLNPDIVQINTNLV